MDAKFIAIVGRLLKEQGADTLINAAKCKAFLNDYAKSEFKRERHLLMIAIEAGAAKEIANASDLETCKKIQIRSLKEDRFIEETAACEIIELLAFVLRGDKNQSIAQTSRPSQSAIQPQYNPPTQPLQHNTPQYAPTSQSQYTQTASSTPNAAPAPQADKPTSLIERLFTMVLLAAIGTVLGAVIGTVLRTVIGGEIGGTIGAVIGFIFGILIINGEASNTNKG